MGIVDGVAGEVYLPSQFFPSFALCHGVRYAVSLLCTNTSYICLSDKFGQWEGLARYWKRIQGISPLL